MNIIIISKINLIFAILKKRQNCNNPIMRYKIKNHLQIVLYLVCGPHYGISACNSL